MNKKTYYRIRQNSRKNGKTDKKAPAMEVEVEMVDRKRIGQFVFCNIRPVKGYGTIRVLENNLILR